MRQYLNDNIKLLEDFCESEGLSVDKIMHSPKCYNQNMMVIQHVDWNKTGEGLRNNKPAKVLLVIRRTEEGVMFEPSDDIKEYLA